MSGGLPLRRITPAAPGGGVDTGIHTPVHRAANHASNHTANDHVQYAIHLLPFVRFDCFHPMQYRIIWAQFWQNGWVIRIGSGRVVFVDEAIVQRRLGVVVEHVVGIEVA